MAQVVYTEVTGDVGVKGSLFEGKKIWFAQNVPSRQRFIQQVQANGGEVVQLEKNADIKLVDHARKEAPAGTYSYQFVELSIRNGRLEILEDHVVGPPAGTTRSIGSIIQPAKGVRTAFTAEDDQFLIKWVTAHEQEGGKAAGNEMYKQLEQKNPHHPWQAWRDRWIKRLQDKPRPVHAPEKGPRTPPSDHVVGVATAKKGNNLLRETEEQNTKFTSEDLETLLGSAEDILNVLQDNLTDAWGKWANEFPGHSAQQWRKFWEETVLPLHKKKEARKAAKDTQKPDQVLSDPRTKTNKPAVKEENELLGSPKMSSTASGRQRSPSYQPKSPSLPVMKPASAHLMNGNDSGNVSLAHEAESGTNDSQSLFLPPFEALLDSNRSPKRKRTAPAVDELPHSSPLQTMTSANKWQRQGSSQEPLEVPSTPEKVPHDVRVPFDTANGVININSDDESASEAVGMPASQSLSEPSHSAHGAEPTFKDATQNLDLELAAPEGGWEDDLPAEVGPTTELDINETQPRTIDTQALLNGRTQVPDFSLPEPDGGWDEVMPSSPPNRGPASSLTVEVALEEKADNDAEGNEADITARLDAWIDSHVAAGMEAEDVALALKCTSMEVDLAEEVLPYLAKHKTIPRNVRGVWTEEDDEDLDASDGRRIRKLQEKHGQEGFDARWDFLRIYRGSA